MSTNICHTYLRTYKRNQESYERKTYKLSFVFGGRLVGAGEYANAVSLSVSNISCTAGTEDGRIRKAMFTENYSIVKLHAVDHQFIIKTTYSPVFEVYYLFQLLHIHFLQIHCVSFVTHVIIEWLDWPDLFVSWHCCVI